MSANAPASKPRWHEHARDVAKAIDWNRMDDCGALRRIDHKQHQGVVAGLKPAPQIADKPPALNFSTESKKNDFILADVYPEMLIKQ